MIEQVNRDMLHELCYLLNLQLSLPVVISNSGTLSINNKIYDNAVRFNVNGEHTSAFWDLNSDNEIKVWSVEFIKLVDDFKEIKDNSISCGFVERFKKV